MTLQLRPVPQAGCPCIINGPRSALGGTRRGRGNGRDCVAEARSDIEAAGWAVEEDRDRERAARLADEDCAAAVIVDRVRAEQCAAA